MKNSQETYLNEDDYLARHYSFKPSISKRKIVGGKSYYVRRYFKGDKDFTEVMKDLATKNVR